MKFRNFAVLVILLSAAGVTYGQQVSPSALEFKGPRAKGFFTVTNTGIQPLTVTVEPMTLIISAEGVPALAPPTVPVTFKQPQFTLGPRAVHMVDFTATCSTLPCHFELLANFMPTKHGEGLTIVQHVGLAVYVCSQQKNCRRDTLKELHYAAPAGGQ